MPLLVSLLVGVMAMEAHTGQAYDIKPAVSTTPTYDMTPPGVEKVEGDDGSLGGPVYDQHHQDINHPNYHIKGTK